MACARCVPNGNATLSGTMTGRAVAVAISRSRHRRSGRSEVCPDLLRARLALSWWEEESTVGAPCRATASPHGGWSRGRSAVLGQELSARGVGCQSSGVQIWVRDLGGVSGFGSPKRLLRRNVATTRRLGARRGLTSRVLRLMYSVGASGSWNVSCFTRARGARHCHRHLHGQCHCGRYFRHCCH